MRVGVTVACAAMLVGAVALVVRLWGTERTPTPMTRAMPYSERLAITAGRTAGMLTGAVLAGVLVIGAGGRLMMRILAVTSPDADGFLTEAEEVVGEVTLGGSLFLVLGLGILSGIAGLVVFAALRRWFPDRSVVAGLAGGAIGAGVLARPSGLLDPDNPDFGFLTPRPLAVALCVGILVLFALLFGPLVDLLAARWARPAWSPRGVASLLPFLLLAPASVFGVLVVATVLLVAWAGPTPTVAQFDAEGVEVPSMARATERIGRVAVLGIAAVAGLATVVTAGQVLAG